MSAADAYSDRPATLAQYLAILRRRKWIIIALPVLSALVAYAASTRQESVYRATSKVRVDLSNVVSAITGITPNTALGDPARFFTTEANVARDRALADRVIEAAGVPGMTADAFLARSSAQPEADANILDLSVTSADPDVASRLATTYAKEFADYKRQLDTASVNAALASVEKTLKPLRAGGVTTSPQYLTLSQYEGQLKTVARLLNNANVQPAESAAKIQPRPQRNAILGGLLGLVVGIGLAFLAEALDKRVRSEQEIEEALGLPLLGRLPRPPRSLRHANRLVMIDKPKSIQAEVFRKLRTSVEFVNLDRSARMIMVTSAGPREGKSTTVANLAVALARAGRRVALVDLDLRRPLLHTFFHVRRDRGITDVVIEQVELDEAIQPIVVPAGAAPSELQTNGRAITEESSGSNGRWDAEGVVHLLPCGTIPPAADEFLESYRVSRVLTELSKQFDVVLVDAPPLLAVGDVMTLSTKVDAIVLVTQLGIHRRQLHELARQLQNCRAPILGFVLTGVSHSDSYSYGYGYDPHVYDAGRERDRRRERV